MIAVIFEVQPKDGKLDEYLQIAAGLRPHLNEVPGFISVERFQSLTDPSKILSVSFYEDEAAVMRWRQTEEHRLAQGEGRNSVFRDYRIRVAEVLRDYTMTRREDAPGDSRDVHG